MMKIDMKIMNEEKKKKVKMRVMNVMELLVVVVLVQVVVVRNEQVVAVELMKNVLIPMKMIHLVLMMKITQLIKILLNVRKLLAKKMRIL